MDPITIGLLLSGGMAAGGTGLGMFGASQTAEAQRRALRDYMGAANSYFDDKMGAMGEGMAQASAMERGRQASLGQLMGDYRNAPQAADPAMGGRLTAAMGEVKQPGGFDYMSGGATQQAQAQQGQLTAADNADITNKLLTSYNARRTEDAMRSADTKAQMRDIVRQAQNADWKERFNLGNMLRDMDWQRQQLALQQQLNDAAGAGGSATALGQGMQALAPIAGLGASMYGGGGGAPMAAPPQAGISG